MYAIRLNENVRDMGSPIMAQRTIGDMFVIYLSST